MAPSCTSATSSSSSSSKSPSTTSAGPFSPSSLLTAWSNNTLSAPPPGSHDLHSAITKTFNLPAKDTYVYHALVSVTLAQVQHAISFGRQHGLHGWYRGEKEGEEPPPQADITAYTSIFSPSTSTPKALNTFASNARKSTHRSRIAAHLLSLRLLPAALTIPKRTQPHANPYLDFWAWSCHELEWCGPDAGTAETKISHHILPVFYHHFGCVVPSLEALEVVRLVAKGRGVLELGSGNGYWAFMLRGVGVEVKAVDNGDSVWRTTWIGDTIKSDGAKYLARNGGAEGEVLLLVYPQVTTEFTKSVLEGYKGSTIVVAGTQNSNGFTAFKDVGVEGYLVGGGRGWKKIVQIALPSFAGKDEGLFVFEKVVEGETVKAEQEK